MKNSDQTKFNHPPFDAEHDEGMPPPPGKMQIDTPMRLSSEIVRLMHQHIDENETKGVMSQKSSRDLLIMLSIKDGVTQLDLVNRTHLKAPTVSVTLQKMEKEGYVSRRPDNYDLRATRVFLTEKGREFDEMMCERIKTEEEIVMQGIDSEEAATAIKVLKMMRDNIINGGFLNGSRDK